MKKNPLFMFFQKNRADYNLIGKETFLLLQLDVTTDQKGSAGLKEHHLRIDESAHERKPYLAPFHYTATLKLHDEPCTYHAYFNHDNQLIVSRLTSSAGDLMPLSDAKAQQLSSLALSSLEKLRPMQADFDQYVTQLNENRLAQLDAVDELSHAIFEESDLDKLAAYQAKLEALKVTLSELVHYFSPRFEGELALINRTLEGIASDEILKKTTPAEAKSVDTPDVEAVDDSLAINAKAQPLVSLDNELKSQWQALTATINAYKAQSTAYYQKPKSKRKASQRAQLFSALTATYQATREFRDNTIRADSVAATAFYARADKACMRLEKVGQQALLSQLQSGANGVENLSAFAALAYEDIDVLISKDNAEALAFLVNNNAGFITSARHPRSGESLLAQSYRANAPKCFQLILSATSDVTMTTPCGLSLAYVLLTDKADNGHFSAMRDALSAHLIEKNQYGPLLKKLSIILSITSLSASQTAAVKGFIETKKQIAKLNAAGRLPRDVAARVVAQQAQEARVRERIPASILASPAITEAKRLLQEKIDEFAKLFLQTDRRRMLCRGVTGGEDVLTALFGENLAGLSGLTDTIDQPFLLEQLTKLSKFYTDNIALRTLEIRCRLVKNVPRDLRFKIIIRQTEIDNANAEMQALKTNIEQSPFYAMFNGGAPSQARAAEEKKAIEAAEHTAAASTVLDNYIQGFDSLLGMLCDLQQTRWPAAPAVADRKPDELDELAGATDTFEVEEDAANGDEPSSLSPRPR